MANDNRTYNAQVIANPYINLSFSGRVFTITERFLELDKGETGSILIDVQSKNYGLTIHATATKSFLYDSLLVSSWSGGTVPNIANRNALFRGITSIQATVLTDVTVEQFVQPDPVISRSVPAGPAGITIGGGYIAPDVPIILPAPITLLMQLTATEKKKDSIADLYVIIHEVGINSIDLGL